VSERIEVYDHVRAGEDAPVEAGIYRVVGTGESVVLVRLTDADGRRRNTGSVVAVSRETLRSAFEPAPNPDDGFALRKVLAPLTTFPKALLYWVRQILR
jgi:hypothetical protein